MATQGFFTKLFDSQLPHKTSSSSSSSSSWVDVQSSKSTIDTGISDFLAEFSLDENSETTLPYDPFVEVDKEKKKVSSLENEWVNVENEIPLAKQKTFPPPISCLKLFKTGKRCNYVSFNREEKKFVVEDLRIPNRDMFLANREGGRLKLYFGVFDDEEDGAEEGNGEEAEIEIEKEGMADEEEK